MKSKSMIAVMLCTVGILPLNAQPASTIHNGFWWLDQTEVVRLAYIIGFADGAGQGHFWLDVLSTTKGNVIERSSKDLVDAQLDFTQVRFVQFKDGLDDFYKDYKNKAVHVDDAFGYVRDSIRGVDQKELAHDLETLRRVAVEPGYDTSN